ncbi:MAG: recombinase family protein, partial [Asgard group archaeon]
TKDQGPESQLLDLRKYVKRRSWEVYQEDVDRGVNGAEENRPALDRLMKNARKRKFDILLVWKFDRFARSTKHLVTALEELEGLGIDFCSYEDSIDTSTNHGKLVFTIMGAIAEFERSLIRERVLAGVRRAKENGIRLGRPPLEVDLDRMKKLALNGNSVREIAKEMRISKSLVHKTLVLSRPASRY